jgi:hypothetical protein
MGELKTKRGKSTNTFAGPVVDQSQGGMLREHNVLLLGILASHRSSFLLFYYHSAFCAPLSAIK